MGASLIALCARFDTGCTCTAVIEKAIESKGIEELMKKFTMLRYILRCNPSLFLFEEFITSAI